MFITAVDEDPVFPPGDVGLRMSDGWAAVHHSHLANHHLHVTGLHTEVLSQS